VELGRLALNYHIAKTGYRLEKDDELYQVHFHPALLLIFTLAVKMRVNDI
jgi:hypothetical protein